MASLPQTTSDGDADVYVDDLPPVEWLSAEEARALFDERARKIAGMSGEDFVRRWEAGEIEDADDSELMALVLMIPFSR